MNDAWDTSFCGVPYNTRTDSFVVASDVPYGQVNVTVIVASGRPFGPVDDGSVGVGDGVTVLQGLVAWGL